MLHTKGTMWALISFAVLMILAPTSTRATKLGPYEAGNARELIDAYGGSGSMDYCDSDSTDRVLGSTSMINSLFATSDIVEIHLDDYFAPKYQGGWQTQMYVKTDSSNVALTKSENERPYGIFFHFLDGNLNAAQLQAPWFRFPTSNTASFSWTEGTAERPVGNLYHLTPNLCPVVGGYIGDQLIAFGNSPKTFTGDLDSAANYNDPQCAAGEEWTIPTGLRATFRFEYDSVNDRTEAKQLYNGVEWPDWTGRAPRSNSSPFYVNGRVSLPVGDLIIQANSCAYNHFDMYVTDYAHPIAEPLKDPVITMGEDGSGNLLKCENDACIVLLAGKTHFRSDPSLSPNDMTSPVTLTGDFAALGNGDQAKIEGEATVILRSDGQELALLNGCFA